jgi:hypothetical protein
MKQQQQQIETVNDQEDSKPLLAIECDVHRQRCVHIGIGLSVQGLFLSFPSFSFRKKASKDCRRGFI